MSDSMAGPEDARSSDVTEADRALLALRAARYAQKPAVVAETLTNSVLFRKGDTRYAAPLGCLREIRSMPAFCPIPGASRCVPGVFHFQGEILSAHALDAFMGRQGPAKPSPWVLIVEHGGERLGLLADEVIDVASIAADEVMPVPVTFGEQAICFQGVLPGGILLLSPARLFTTSSFFSAF